MGGEQAVVLGLLTRGCWQGKRLCSTFSRVPTQIVLSNSLCFPCVFPVQPQIFPVPLSIVFNYYIHKTDFADLSTFWEKNGNFHGKYSNILHLWHQGIYNLGKQNSLCFPCVLAKFVFPDRDFFLSIFPVFPVPWVPCFSNTHPLSPSITYVY